MRLAAISAAVFSFAFGFAATDACAQANGIVRNVHIEMTAAGTDAAPTLAPQPTPITATPAITSASSAPVQRASSNLALSPDEEVLSSGQKSIATSALTQSRATLSSPGHFPTPPTPSHVEITGNDPAILHVRHGVTANFDVSANEPNMVATPFQKPKVVVNVQNNEDPSGSRVWGSDVFFTPKKETTVFIKDAAVPNSAVVTLHLIPQTISGRSVTLVLDGAIPSNRPDSGDSSDTPSSYVEGITETMKKAVLNQIPDGYTEAPLDAPMAISGPVQATPVGRYAGSESDIYHYRLVDTGTQPITLSEEAFASDQVRAVTIFPNLSIQPGQATDVYIMFAKQGM